MTIDNTELILQFGQAIGTAVGPFIPAFQKMALDELIAVKALLNQKDTDAVLAIVHEKMTLDELAAEKLALVPVANAMADTSAAKKQAAQAVLTAILKAAFVIALGMVGL
jgi:hypothetical protein